MNPASMLGKMAKGVPKKYSDEEIAKRTDRIKAAQKKRAAMMRAKRNTELSNSREGDAKKLARNGTNNPTP